MTTVGADVVVVGGGSTGCVVAGRVSEDPSCSVVLVEAGHVVSAEAEYPAEVIDAHVLPIGPGSRWISSYPAALTDSISRSIARGRVLGGSGAVNGAYFVRARPGDFDAWPSSWSWENVLPFFVASETDHDACGEWHGSDGPMPVSRVPVEEASDITRAFVSAAVEAGFAFEQDKNDPASNGGAGPVPRNVFRGKRVNTAAAYLLPHMSRRNLTVLGDSTVLRVVVEGAEVVGVDVLRDGAVSRVTAKTVILCAGAVRTPHLLMMSGIGPANHLSSHGISVVLDHACVGQGFSDHPEVGVYYRSSFEAVPASPLEAVLHTGDLEIRPFTAAFDRMIPGLSISDPMIGVALMRPESRGRVELQSDDPLTPPMVRYRYLESTADRVALRDGVDIVADLFGRSALRGAVPLDVFGDPLEAHLGTSLHLSGSCAMGGPAAVLDERCRVRGVEGLLVADTSAFPVVPSRGPHATAIMLAERVAALWAGDDGVPGL